MSASSRWAVDERLAAFEQKIDVAKANCGVYAYSSDMVSHLLEVLQICKLLQKRNDELEQQFDRLEHTVDRMQ